MDPPPQIPPEEKLSERELAELALRLLRMIAQDDPAVAERMRRLGLEPNPPGGDAASGPSS